MAWIDCGKKVTPPVQQKTFKNVKRVDPLPENNGLDLNETKYKRPEESLAIWIDCGNKVTPTRQQKTFKNVTRPGLQSTINSGSAFGLGLGTKRGSSEETYQLDNFSYKRLKKSEKCQLQGTDCPDCFEYYEDFSDPQTMKNKISKHRVRGKGYNKWNPPPSPPNSAEIWSTVMPTTEEAIACGLIGIGSPLKPIRPKRHDLLD